MSVSAERVAAAWSAGFRASGSHIYTDGKTVNSWGHHEIGRTDKDGRKIADCCHYSQSTSVHSSSLFEWADEVVECSTAGREELHKDGPRVHWRRPVLLDLCRAGPTYRKPTKALRAHPTASCAFVCLFCGGWHVNESWTHEARESAREHVLDEQQDGLGTHRLNPGAPDTDELFRSKGFANAEEYHRIDKRIIYGDNMDGLATFYMWQLLDQTKGGLLAAFPQLLEPQPTARLWWVVKYGKSQWHRAWGSNPQIQNGAFPALCGLPPDGDERWHHWGRQRIERPTGKSRVCVECDTLAAVSELTPERQADIERVLQESETRFRIQQMEYAARIEQ